MGQIESLLTELRQRGQTGLITYFTVGYPDLEATFELVLALVRGGADIVELGVPYSDPLSDGATIQRASQVALAQGVSLTTCLHLAAELREAGVTVPLLLMSYYNPVLRYGPETLAADARAAGVNGFVLPDLPPEEAAGLRRACRERGLDLIFLLAPTSTEERMAKICSQASGFIYCVSLTGVTGARRELPPSLSGFLERVRRHTDLPLAVGFGVSTPQHFRQIGRLADAAVIGSALIDLVERSPRPQQALALERYLRQLRGAHSAARSPRKDTIVPSNPEKEGAP